MRERAARSVEVGSLYCLAQQPCRERTHRFAGEPSSPLTASQQAEHPRAQRAESLGPDLFEDRIGRRLVTATQVVLTLRRYDRSPHDRLPLSPLTGTRTGTRSRTQRSTTR